MLWTRAPHQYRDPHSRHGVYCMQMDKDKIVAGLRDTTIAIYDRHTLEERRRLRGHMYDALQHARVGQTELDAHAHCHAGRGRWCRAGARGSVLCLQYDATKIVSGSSDASVMVTTSARKDVSRRTQALTRLLDP